MGMACRANRCELQEKQAFALDLGGLRWGDAESVGANRELGGSCLGDEDLKDKQRDVLNDMYDGSEFDRWMRSRNRP